MNVEEVFHDRGIDYKTVGHDHLIRCLNPDHEDTNPSLRVDKNTGAMNCFSCGFSGNIFSHFDEIPNYLEIKRQQLKKTINTRLRETVGLQIPTNAVPIENSWRGISANTLRKFSAFQHNDKQFNGRMVFPVKDIRGKIVGFIGRSTVQGMNAKYLVHPQGVNLPLFPIVKPIKGKVILVEGIFDMLNLHDKGLTNAVACFGTKLLNKQKLSTLKVQGVSGVDLIFDPDSAGERATKDAEGLCEKVELVSRKVRLHQGDPGDLTAPQVIKLKEELYGSSEESSSN